MTTTVTWALCAATVLGVLAASVQADPPPDSKASEAAEFRKKWSAVEVARDLDHIRKDVAKMIELSNAGVLSADELSFYYFRIHDFDNNNLLDGQEMMSAMFHHHDDDKDERIQVISEADIISYVDSALLADKTTTELFLTSEMRA
uniref:Putative multiple coagulation factor deficiency 2-like protein n=1 Tax=Amblyomma tuberculatum TaxID=48802 RepID=A0A6M2E392_9ACAR